MTMTIRCGETNSLSETTYDDLDILFQDDDVPCNQEEISEEVLDELGF